MVDLAEHQNGDPVPLKEVAERQEISSKYAESIMAILSKGDLVIAERGKSGGYRLSRDPSSYTVGEILTLTEGSLHPVACLEEGARCPREGNCRTLAMWQRLDRMLTEFFNGVTIEDLIEKEDWSDYVI